MIKNVVFQHIVEKKIWQKKVISEDGSSLIRIKGYLNIRHLMYFVDGSKLCILSRLL